MSARVMGALARSIDSPNLSLDFTQCDTAIDTRITFTRASTAWRCNSAGVLVPVASNVPRIDFDPITLASKGLLIEETRTNLLLRSEDMATTWAGGSKTISTDVLVSPDSTTNADAFMETTAASAFHYLNQSVSKAASAIAYSFSGFLKDKGRSVEVGMSSDGGANGAVLRCTPSTGAITAPATYGSFSSVVALPVVAYPNAWYRVPISATSSTAASVVCQWNLHNGSSNVYTGDGSSGTYPWGAQLETGLPTSYIQTTSAQATRAADAPSMSGTAFTDFYNQAAGTFLVEFSGVHTDQVRPLLVVRQSDSNYRMQITPANAVVVNNGVIQANVGDGVVSRSSGKVAFAYSAGDFQWAVNGVAAAAATSGTLPTSMTTLLFGHFDFGGAIRCNGCVARVTYWPRRRPVHELQSITT